MEERTEYGFELERLGDIVPVQTEPPGCPADALLHVR
jgi:hypothetical protein